MIVWVWLGNIFQLPSPQPWPRGSKSVRLFLSVAFPRIPCLSACQHLSCLLTNSGCCFCLPRVSWNRRKKKKKTDRFPCRGHLVWKKETSLNIAVLYIWLNFTNSLPFDLCLFVDVKMRWPVGSEKCIERIIFTKGKHKNHLLHFPSFFFFPDSSYSFIYFNL